jgi:hypothetical protein
MAKKITETSDAETELAECVEQQKHIDACRAKIEDCKEALKEAKETWEAAVERLGGMLRDGDRPLLEGEDRP